MGDVGTRASKSFEVRFGLDLESDTNDLLHEGAVDAVIGIRDQKAG